MTGRERIKRFLYDGRAIWVIVLLALIERIILFFWLGSGKTCDSDDVAYLQSGIVFAQTGVISVWTNLPTAAIMPGVPVLTGLLYKIFGEGSTSLYIDAVRIVWILMGSLTPYFLYRCACFHMPRPYALFAAAGFLLPNWAWSDNAVLTEAPYLLFYMICLFFVFRLGEAEHRRGDVAGFVLSFMAALMIRANILIFLPFALAYLLLVKKQKLRQLLLPALALAAAMLVFVIPWSIRNWEIYGRFIPITTGTANPGLLGSYQGETAPADDSLDYENNVYRPVREQYPQFFNPDGSLNDAKGSHRIPEIIDKVKTEYRLRVWFERDPMGLIWAYFFSKPACMLNWVWLWLPLPGLYYVLRFLSQVNLVMCAGTAALSLILKRKRDIMLWLGGTYVLNLYIIAMSFASERYAAMFMPLRYMLAALGLYLAVEWLRGRKRKKAAAAA